MNDPSQSPAGRVRVTVRVLYLSLHSTHSRSASARIRQRYHIAYVTLMDVVRSLGY